MISASMIGGADRCGPQDFELERSRTDHALADCVDRSCSWKTIAECCMGKFDRAFDFVPIFLCIKAVNFLRTGAINKNKPVRSLKRPGIASNSAPIKNNAQCSSPWSGDSPATNLAFQEDIISEPCLRSNAIPATPEKIDHAITGAAPIDEPSSNKRYSSMRGTMMNRSAIRLNTICSVSIPQDHSSLTRRLIKSLIQFFEGSIGFGLCLFRSLALSRDSVDFSKSLKARDDQE